MATDIRKRYQIKRYVNIDSWHQILMELFQDKGITLKQRTKETQIQ